MRTSNLLNNGAVLPSGLIGVSSEANLAAFKKTYQNTSLRVGIIIQSYGPSDDGNVSKILPEYDVLTFEQNEDRGAAPSTYKNCIAATSFGGVADFLEFTYRKIETKTSQGVTPSFSGQNGSIVMILCLDGLSERAIIIGAMSHPDRKTTLTDADPHLEGEYNGVNIVVNKDGSTSLTFKGATDNDGNPTDTSQGNTELSIEKDGSYQVEHSTITQRLDKNGKASLTTTDDISNTTQTSYNVTTQKDVNISAQGDLNASMNNLAFNAQGNASLQCQQINVQAQSAIQIQGSQWQVQAESMAGIKAPSIVLDGIVSLGGEGGQPLLTLSTMTIGVGNLGISVISFAISGFTLKVTGQ